MVPEKPLTGVILHQQLKQLHQDWYVHSLPPEHLIRTFTFTDFDEAFAFVKKVGHLAQQEQHHPNIRLYDFKRVDIQLSTHEVGGITLKDIELATKIEQQL